MTKPTNDEAISAWMRGMGAERTIMDEWRLPSGNKDDKPYVFFDDNQARFFYAHEQRACEEAAIDEVYHVRNCLESDTQTGLRDNLVPLGIVESRIATLRKSVCDKYIVEDTALTNSEALKKIASYLDTATEYLKKKGVLK